MAEKGKNDVSGLTEKIPPTLERTQYTSAPAFSLTANKKHTLEECKSENNWELGTTAVCRYPAPGTGAWTGALIAVCLKLKKVNP